MKKRKRVPKFLRGIKFDVWSEDFLETLSFITGIIRKESRGNNGIFQAKS